MSTLPSATTRPVSVLVHNSAIFDRVERQRAVALELAASGSNAQGFQPTHDFYVFYVCSLTSYYVHWRRLTFNFIPEGYFCLSLTDAEVRDA